MLTHCQQFYVHKAQFSERADNGVCQEAFISREITSALIATSNIACGQLVAMKEPTAKAELIVLEKVVNPERAGSHKPHHVVMRLALSVLTTRASL